MHSVKFGGLELPIIDSTDSLVPAPMKCPVFPASDRKALAIAMRDDHACLLIGETGTGKTSMVRYLASLVKQPYVRVNMTGYTTPDELIGSKSVKEGKTYYEHGIVTDAMIRGAVLVLDEINATTPDCMFILHGLLDDDKRITLPNGDVITPHPNFRVFATCNPDYEGTKALNKALLDRFTIILSVDVLTPKSEIALLKDRTAIDESLANQLVTIATMLRKDYTENKIGTYTSTRSLLKIATLAQSGLDIKEAFKSVLMRKTQDTSEQKILLDVFASVFKLNISDGDMLDMPYITTKREICDLEEKVGKYRSNWQEEYTKRVTIEQENEKRRSTMESLGQDIKTMTEKIIQLDKKIAEQEELLKQYKWIEDRLTSLKNI